MKLTQNDQELINLAQNKLAEIFVPDKHFVVSALQAKSGKVYLAYNLKATATRASVCAESTALAIALNAGEKNLQRWSPFPTLTAMHMLFLWFHLAAFAVKFCMITHQIL